MAIRSLNSPSCMRSRLTSSLIRSLLLFFDGVAIVVSRYRLAQAITMEPDFFLPFLQSDMSKLWMPEDFFDADFRTAYQTEVRSLVSSGWFDNRPHNITMDNYIFPSQAAFLPPELPFQDEVARFRDQLIAHGANNASDRSLLNELIQRGLAEVRQHVPMSGFQRGDPAFVGIPAAVSEGAQFPTVSPFITGTPISTGLPFPTGIPGMPTLPAIPSSHVLALDATFSQVNNALVSQFARFRAGQRF